MALTVPATITSTVTVGGEAASHSTAEGGIPFPFPFPSAAQSRTPIGRWGTLS
jgi:hypothetical protein